MFLKNCWYVAGWDYEFVGKDIIARTILNEPIIFYRTEDKTVVALADACCHRLAPLSEGRREGDCIQCMYHGMKFDSSGRCVEIPGQTKIPEKARVRSYPIVEKNRWVWIWMGDPAEADTSIIPDAPWLDDPEWQGIPPGYLHFNASYELLNDNLLDFAHVGYVHPTTLGGSEEFSTSSETEIDRLSRGVRISRWLLDRPAAPFAEKLLNSTSNFDRWNIYNYLVPGILIMDSGFAPTGQGAKNGNREGGIEFRSCQAVTPETDKTSHYFFSQPRNFSNGDPIIDEMLSRMLLAAFQEDKAMLEAQQKRWEQHGEQPLVMIQTDAALVRFRRLMDELKAKESGDSAKAAPAV